MMEESYHLNKVNDIRIRFVVVKVTYSVVFLGIASCREQKRHKKYLEKVRVE